MLPVNAAQLLTDALSNRWVDRNWAKPVRVSIIQCPNLPSMGQEFMVIVSMPEHWQKIPEYGVVLHSKKEYVFDPLGLSYGVMYSHTSEIQLLQHIGESLCKLVSKNNSPIFESDPRIGQSSVTASELFDPQGQVCSQDLCSICDTDFQTCSPMWAGGNLCWVHPSCLWRLYQQSGMETRNVRNNNPR